MLVGAHSELHELTLRGGERPSYVIKLTWNDDGDGVYWVNFSCWNIAGWEEDGSFWFSDGNGNFEKDRETITPGFNGHVKWDGCNEWEYDNTHGCYAIDGLRERHQAEEACLRFAHAVMTRGENVHVDWEVPEG